MAPRLTMFSGRTFQWLKGEAVRRLIAGITAWTTIRKVAGHNDYAAKAYPGFRVGMASIGIWNAAGVRFLRPPLMPLRNSALQPGPAGGVALPGLEVLHADLADDTGGNPSGITRPLRIDRRTCDDADCQR